MSNCGKKEDAFSLKKKAKTGSAEPKAMKPAPVKPSPKEELPPGAIPSEMYDAQPKKYFPTAAAAEKNCEKELPPEECEGQAKVSKRKYPDKYYIPKKKDGEADECEPDALFKKKGEQEGTKVIKVKGVKKGPRMSISKHEKEVAKGKSTDGTADECEPDALFKKKGEGEKKAPGKKMKMPSLSMKKAPKENPGKTADANCGDDDTWKEHDSRLYFPTKEEAEAHLSQNQAKGKAGTGVRYKQGKGWYMSTAVNA